MSEYTDYPCDAVVVDNGSRAGITELVEKYAGRSGSKVQKLSIIRNDHNIGVAPAWNQILKVEGYEYYGITNNDIAFGPSWLSPLVKCLDHNKDIGWLASQQNGDEAYKTTRDAHARLLRMRVNPHQIETFEQVRKMLNDACQPWNGLVGFTASVRNDTGKMGHRLSQWKVATCFILRKAMIDELGFFDERYAPVGLHEDSEYWMRMEKNGKWLYATLNESVVFHFTCMTRKGPGFGDGLQYEIERELNWRKAFGTPLHKLPQEKNPGLLKRLRVKIS